MPTKKQVDSHRDNFSAQVIRILAERSGGKCAICRAPTWGPNDCQFKSTNIGQAAHITAAAPGGPRYDPNLSPQSRSSVLNGIWLCGNCHNIIDKNVDEYPVKKLQIIKKEAEAEAKQGLGVADINPTSRDDSAITIATSATAIMEIRKVRTELGDLIQDQKPKTHPYEFLEKLKYIDVAKDPYSPAVGSELVQFYKLLVTFDSDQHTWLHVIRLLHDSISVFLPSLTQNDVDMTCAIVGYMLAKKKGHGRDQRMLYQSAIAFLTKLANQLNTRRANLRNTAMDDLKKLSEDARPKRAGRDETDAGEEATKFKAIVEESFSPSDWTFLSAMCNLAELSSDDQRKIQEQSLEEQGYITYII